MMRIGEVVTTLAISADTLRYYEKIKLIPKVHRNNGGVRFYSDKDLSRLRFIKRAQKMGFSLEEITQLLKFRENPQKAKPKVRELAHHKLEEVEQHLTELTTLRNELRLLTNLCGTREEGCPILESFDKETDGQ
ncbi:MAG: heavy metal-responsive transcriptional regulator [Alcanivoracaceae bacterium]|jgi:DNA-binding transcriptional MerR regulator|nr:heavy metal-responsive transcriptional regulator [Alcanivoracaceae bacterium]|tara:strand:- start:2314 stop:2715 length:402 start_codon:yes stop_codon:yes gene_type:complete